MSVCLSMIVKDEAGVIERCLTSVRPLIDSWVIVDTGSTDGTQDVVRACLADVPGTLVERPWVDFAHNRTEAIELARGAADYLFVIDADEVLELDPAHPLPPLEADSYTAEMHYGGCTYLRRVLVRATLPWRYRGVVHEYLECPAARSESFLPGMRVVPHRDGARSRDPHTYRRDALLLERALIDDPDDARSVFYLAQSYRDAGDYELAVRHYRRRVEMGGWPEEVWYSLYQIAQLMERMGEPWPEVADAYLRAHEHTPDRAGPLFRIGLHHQGAGERRLAHLFLSAAMRIPRPGPERLFVERALYDYALPMEYAVACFWAGDHEAAIAAGNALLRSPALPPELIEQAVRNRRFSLDALAGPPEPAAEPAHVTVVVPLDGAGLELDACVESLLRQQPAEGVAFAFAAADASAVDAARLPLEDPRASLHALSLRELVATLPPEEVVVPLAPDSRLADAGVLEAIAATFADRRCTLLYGPERGLDGAPSAVEPAASAARFADHLAGLAAPPALAFRARLMEEAAPGAALTAVLWSAAGFAGARFADAPWRAATSAPVPAPPPAVAAAREPLVSCLLVTRDRLLLARRAIESFAAQTHRTRELVIVTDGDERFRAALARHAAACGVADAVRVVVPEAPGSSLGALRNLSLEAARGGVVCQWDDDDVSHPQRVERQLAALRDADAGACLMTEHLHLMEDRGLLSWIDWSDGGRIEGVERFAPGTLMMRRDVAVRYPEDGEWARRGEDSALLAGLAERVPIAPLTGAGELWLYTYHGRNTFPVEHHERMAAFGAPAAALHERAETIRAAADCYRLARPLVVAGRDGIAFAIR